jgi:dihydroflavonol-4-reductase
MNIFLTGITGFLGRHVAEACREAGHDTMVLVRPRSRFKDHVSAAFEVRSGDLGSVDELTEKLRGAEAVIHCAADTALTPFNRKWSTNIEGLRNLVSAAHRTGTISRFIHLSSASTIVPGTAQNPSDEACNAGPTSDGLPYVNSKIIGEQILLNEFSKDGFPVSILHPSFILGPGDRRGGSSRLIRHFSRGGIQFHASGGKNIVDARDVAQAAVSAVTRAQAGQRYLLTNESISYAGLIDMVSRFSQRSAVKIELPPPAWKTVGYMGTILSLFTSDGQSLNHKSMPQAFVQGYYNCGKAQRELSFSPRPLAETIEDTVMWIKDQKSVA